MVQEETRPQHAHPLIAKCKHTGRTRQRAVRRALPSWTRAQMVVRSPNPRMWPRWSNYLVLLHGLDDTMVYAAVSPSIILLRVDTKREWPKPAQFSSPRYHKEFADFCMQDQIPYHRFLKCWAIPPPPPFFPLKSAYKRVGTSYR